jgi:hypothetical protein
VADSDSGCVSALADDKAHTTDDLTIPSFLARTGDAIAAGPAAAETVSKPQSSWRDHLKVHPAADMLPRMSETEFQALKDDIEKNGLRSSVVLYQRQLLDGRHRLDALEQLGLLWAGDGRVEWFDRRGCDRFELFEYHGDGKEPRDPYDLVLSLNIHRRHLTDEQRRELIAKLIKAKPEASDRAIAKKVKRDHKTVAKVRKKMESTGEVSPVEKRLGADGKQRKKPKKIESDQERRDREECVALFQKVLDAEKEAAAEHRATGSAEISIEQRRAENALLDDPVDQDDIVNRALSLVSAMDHDQLHRFHHHYKLYMAATYAGARE